MSAFIIEGGHPLSGDITPQGAKNEALQVICATLLTDEPVTISNIPNIRDVNNLIQLLKDIGVKVSPPRPPLGGRKETASFTPPRGGRGGPLPSRPTALISAICRATSSCRSAHSCAAR